MRHLPPVVPPLLDLPRALCNHLIGEHHTLGHRMFVGVIVMVCGVGVAHTATVLPEAAGFVADLTGYLIHGIGATPFVEAMMLARKL